MLRISQELTATQVAQILDLITRLNNVDSNAFSSDASVALKIKKLKYRLASPLCAEQVISVLLGLLSLKHEHKVLVADLIPDAEEAFCFNLLIDCILPLLRLEQNAALLENATACLESYFRRKNELKFFRELADMHKEFISCIDIDYVMDDAATLHASNEKTADKNAVVLLGKSGAGKSFLIKYLCCDAMFSRKHEFGNIKSLVSKSDGKLTIDESKQPEALKAIKIGDQAVSETYAMGVVALDDGISKGLEKFKGKDYVLCDTPGAGDNRKMFGEEQKLVNALQTVVPLYQAKSVRMIVLFSAGAADKRGDDLRETMVYAASMFADMPAVRSAAESMVFAITGDDGYSKVATFKSTLKSILENRVVLNLSEQAVALMEVLQDRLDNNRVHFIRPLKGHSATPESLMKAVEECAPIHPRLMTPFAEVTVVDLVKSEATLVSQALLQILDSLALEKNLSSEMLEAQLQRLTQKFGKLCFMDAYYSFAKVQLEPIFKRLVSVVNSYRDFALGTLCPGFEAIDIAQADRALKYLESLRQLEAIITHLTQGQFAENRDSVVMLLRLLNTDRVLGEEYRFMLTPQWALWVKQNTPVPASQEIIEAMQNFKADVANKLRELSRLLLNEIYDAHAEEVAALPTQPLLSPVPYAAAIIKLKADSRTYLGYARQSLGAPPHDFTPISHSLANCSMMEYQKEVRRQHEELCTSYFRCRIDVVVALRNTINNLHYIERYLDARNDAHSQDVAVMVDVAPPPAYDAIVPSAPEYSISFEAGPKTAVDNFKGHAILIDQNNELQRQLESYAHAAIAKDDFYIAMQVMACIETVNEIFGCRPGLDTLGDLRAVLKQKFNQFLSDTFKQLDRLNATHVMEDVNQQQLLRAFQIERIRGSVNLYTKYLANTDASMYPSIHEISLSSYASLIVHLFSQLKSAAERICKNDFTLSAFNELNDIFSKLGLLLSLPNEQHATLVAEYDGLKRQVANYCLTVRGKLIGTIQSGQNTSELIYKNIATYLTQVASLPLMHVLELGQSGDDIISVIIKRVTELCGNLKTISVQIGEDGRLAQGFADLTELNAIAAIFKTHLDKNLQSEVEQSQHGMMGKVDSVLRAIRRMLESNVELNAGEKMSHAVANFRYLNQCSQLGIHKPFTNTIKLEFDRYIKAYANELHRLSVSLIQRMAPTAANQDRASAAAELISLMQLLKTTSESEPALYALTGEILVTIGRQIAALVLQYREALTQTLLAPASLGAENTFTNLLARVNEFQSFDVYIKFADRNVETFKRLHKRFQNAQNEEHYPKIKDIMQAVYDRQYEKAQELVSAEKMFAPGSDMRKVLTEQVDYAIGALTMKIASAIAQLKSQPLNCRVAISDLIHAYKQIKSAHRLVEAKMMSESLLNDRERLLQDTTTSLNAWTGYCLVSFDTMLQHFDLKSALAALQEYPALVTAMDDMKPMNHAAAEPKLKEQFSTLVKSFSNQYEQPVEMWVRHSSSIANVARALLGVMQEAYEGRTYGQYWESISAQIAKTLKERCEDILVRFKDNRYDMENAITALEEVVELTSDMPDESTKLAECVREYVRLAADAITNENLASKNREQTLRNLQALYQRQNARKNAVANFKHGSNANYLADQEQNLRTSIMEVLDVNQLPHKLLADYQQLADFFPDYELFTKGKRILKQRVKDVVDGAIDSITYNMSLYYEGKNKDEALTQVQLSLVTLTHAQMLLHLCGGRNEFVHSDLMNRVSNATKGIRETLNQNSSRFQSAIAAKSVFDLEQPLTIARAFQTVTTRIQQYVTACHTRDITQDLRDLMQVANDLAYTPLRQQIIQAVLEIRKKLEFLQPDALTEAGSEVRKSYYGELKKNFEFLSQLVRLRDHFELEFLSSFGIDTDFTFTTCCQSLASFLSETFRRAFHQLMTTQIPTTEVKWTHFNTYYQELTLFVEEFKGHVVLNSLRLRKRDLFADQSYLDGDIPAATVIGVIQDKFNEYLSNVINNFHRQFGADVKSDKYDSALCALLTGLQKMSEDMPALGSIVNEAIRNLLLDVMKAHAGDRTFTANIAELLSNEPKGYGASVIASQPVFAGMNDANRNRMTKEQTIEYVIKHLQVHDKRTKEVRHLLADEAAILQKMYSEFMSDYSRMLADYTSHGKNFAKNRVAMLEDLKRELFSIIRTMGINYDRQNHIVWNAAITAKVPAIFSYLFLIWTLNVSSGFFDASNVDNDQDFLKKPHPAQMTALFLMFNMLEQQPHARLKMLDRNQEIMRSKFNEVLTGEGKSVIIASTAAFLCLIGFAASPGCYSDYLSDRDAKEFEWFYQFLDITSREDEQDILQHGTFNRLSESKLNSRGDLRDLLSNRLFGTHKPIVVKRPHGRQTIAIVDEADSLVTAFFGYMYQPYFLYQDQLVNELLEAVWLKHERRALNTVHEIFNIPQFQALVEKFKDLEYIFKLAAIEMYDGLQKYKREQGHDFYVNNKGEIYYKQFDGTSTKLSIGYQTYWACVDRSNRINPLCAASHRGIKVTIGAYSYADLMIGDNYRAMFGVTGTYRQLTAAEKGVVKDVFNIHEEDVAYIPSAYGKNKLQFNPGVNFTVVEDDEHTARLAEEIIKNRIGWNNPNVTRPVIVFFDTEEALEAFAKTSAFLDIPGKEVVKMTSETITTAAERDSAIKRATRAGTITLAYREHGRGNDFILKAKQVIANGGCHVIDEFMPETEADQRQHQGRAARQGQDGSFSMVIRKSEILRKFNMTEAEFEAYKANGHLYEKVCEKRNLIFSEKYLSLVGERDEMVKTVHEPSMRLIEVLTDSRSRREDIIAAHKATLPNVEAAVKAHIKLVHKNASILILFDSTGSMGSLIEALKAVLSNVVQALAEVLRDAGASFRLQIGHYEDYCSGDDRLFRHTRDWSDKPEELKGFISAVKADGGGGNAAECVEVGLFYANQLAKRGDVINHVILIGDEPPTRPNFMPSSREKLSAKCAYKNVNDYVTESKSLAVAKVPVSTFFVRNETFKNILDEDRTTFTTQRTFKEIADITGGEAGELNLADTDVAKESVIGLLGRRVTTEVAADDKTGMAASALYEKFRSRMKQFSK